MEELQDFPLQIQLSLTKVFEMLKKRMKQSQNPITREYMKSILNYAEGYPELTEGIKDFDNLDEYDEPLSTLLDNLFPAALTKNEIKAATIPFQNKIFNPTRRFASIIEEAGPDFELKIRDLDTEFYYILGCVIILNSYYGYEVDISRPLYYEIPDKNGIIRSYRAAMNADFTYCEPTDNAIEITSDIADKLIANGYDYDLWREYFPPQSWILKGITILNLTDVTVDDSISDLKSTLLSKKTLNENTSQQFQEIFSAIFNIADLRVGFTEFDKGNDLFTQMADETMLTSFILNKDARNDCRKSMCDNAYNSLVKDKSYFIIPDVEEYARKNQHNILAENLLSQGAKSCILAPIAKGNELLAVLELVSETRNKLHSLNATKLDDVMPFIVSTVERKRNDLENRIKAVIQSECTSIHPSVLWIFEEEAKRFIKNQDAGKFAAFKDIAFEDVYPLYGQIDIVGSSDERNSAIQKDILIQLKMVDTILELALKAQPMPIYEQVKFRIEEFTNEIKDQLNANSESEVFALLKEEVNPLLNHLNTKIPELKKAIDNYKTAINKDTGLIYENRKHYDETVQLINQNLATFIDRKQQEAQEIFPHYFERYKTDGVDHNIYIGASMTPTSAFNEVYLYNLRLWQLSTMCEMENHFYHKQEGAELQLDAASLILVFSTTLSIRYRMDEKKFDVDGTYNARYEIIKKRIDKACIKGSDERVTQKGKIAIVYSQDSDAEEYTRYINYLQRKKYLGQEVEYVELEDVQGVVGLKAIRVNVLYTSKLPRSKENQTITYDDLMEVLDS
ncbi:MULTISPECIES: GAF domain-containing protein [unclassified Leeuwenhoekiella]|uniref:GAF domain-containing protein n=1 Tax=unclassified Leeuwenhoekiella TaxID=2615029 RepID=UPI000C5E20DA|nr:MULTISPECIES: GAF domain-containing protein [unclassified Leeuwenhoekiella]MAW94814.1 GAF domain-containing protein [Leeuwenhoekiella sp.]MBA79534.1 GAF domain-containing protein [Leeuwenhoekiella sp.]|tara:strand:- start:23681 stop:26059 length:2379 start_codon:yes stop_codon:yes gene_type:complete